MKIYTEVNYTWDDEKNELVKESEKSFDYEGELVQCIKIGGYSFKPPVVSFGKPPVIDIPTPNIADNLSGILEDNSSISYGGSTTPNIPTAPNINIPDSSHPTSMLNAGLSTLGNNIDYGVGGAGKIIHRNLNELAKLGKEAMTGEGGYLDDEGPGPAAPGPTGFEAATAQRTLLTGQRRKGQGRSAHSGSGSASQVGPR
jgi:hypothetical protein